MSSVSFLEVDNRLKAGASTKVHLIIWRGEIEGAVVCDTDIAVKKEFVVKHASEIAVPYKQTEFESYRQKH